MQLPSVPPALRSRLGADAAKELTEMCGQYHLLLTDRFERRLVEEVSRLRVEMERMRGDLIKWNLLCWIGQFAAIVAALSYMLD